MEKKADVKAMMARFQPNGASVDETSSLPAGRIKQPLQPTLSSSPTIQAKKPVLESHSGGAINIPPKPNFLKSKSDVEAHEPNKTKALASRFGNIQDDTNTKPCVVNKPFSQAPEAKGSLQKPPFNKPSDSKPGFPKPSPALNSKPSWVKDGSGGGLQRKPSSSIGKLRQQNEETAGAGTNTANKPLPLPNAALKPTSNFRTAQNNFNKDSESGGKADGANKPLLTPANAVPPPKPLVSKKPSLNKPRNLSPTHSNISDGSSCPKRHPLPNSLALGPAPAKPNRPPRVNLESFKRGAVANDNGPGAFKKPILPTLLTSHPTNQSNHVTPTQPPQTAVPSLPPRHPGAMMQQDECYDDIDEFNSAPPPLPPSTGHPSQRAKVQEEEDDDDEEMYQDLDERWEEAEQQEKKKEKDDKEEKKRLEAEKKEQKEREKKEQDARKKFKLVGPLEVIHQGKALVDCRSSKNDLALKQGDCLDIIRVQGNPEGRWLGRTPDGSIGYVKTTSVEIDFNSLKNRQPQQEYDPEVYDDIDVIAADKSGMKGQGVLPPLPGDDGEIYDDVLDLNMEIRAPPLSQFTADRNSEEAIDDEIYDDVDSQNLPPLPPISSLPILKGKSKPEEMDPKKQKKLEKEEKDFRKKFKYDGEIEVLYQVTISSTLTNKKWSAKELPVKAGEKLNVIVKAVDNKLICRNEEGKFGYVSTSHVDMNDGDIYDDIGDDCIYDND
ncbi:FYN-binding protein 1 isoform X2 [Clinocottus analis]|uniref:FYN-binding protein 1 isoform X2 n=1 Tax=Clinocottus analis TaxID=304258 RepID=UPI0035C1EED2